MLTRFGSKRSDQEKGVTSEIDANSDSKSDSDDSSVDGRKHRANSRATKAIPRDDENDDSF